MTQQIVERWSQLRGLDYGKAMLELRFLGDILAVNKKAPAPTGANESLSTTILSQMDDPYEDQNQICLEI